MVSTTSTCRGFTSRGVRRIDCSVSEKVRQMTSSEDVSAAHERGSSSLTSSKAARRLFLAGIHQAGSSLHQLAYAVWLLAMVYSSRGRVRKLRPRRLNSQMLWKLLARTLEEGSPHPRSWLYLVVHPWLRPSSVVAQLFFEKLSTNGKASQARRLH